MKSYKRVLVLFVLVGLLCVGAPARAERATDFAVRTDGLLAPPPPGWPEDALSTSGPVPPPEAMRAQLSPSAASAQVILYDVPAYKWRDGCGPTSAGMVIGYWDGKGFDNLVSGSAATQTTAVDAMISSSQSFSDYALPLDSYPANPSPLPDKSEAPFGDEHADNSIADFMDTSQSHRGLYYGWSYYSDMPTALTSWVQLAAPQYQATASNDTLPDFWGGTFTWDKFKAEIDAGRPVILLVDTDKDGWTDHFVAAMGYGEDGNTRLYYFRNTWDYDIHWYPFVPMRDGVPWGIYGATLFRIQALTPGAFGKTSPSNGAWGQGSNVTLGWGNSSDATSYEYCFNTNNSACDGSWTFTTSTSANLTGLTSGVIYYWQVRANNWAGSTYANGGGWWLWTTAPFPPLFMPLMGR